MERTTVCIAGGGPAGMVLALLLARAGVEVTVLEKHADFRRDFRGDTVHPTTMELLEDLGLRKRFEKLPKNRIDEVVVPVGGGGLQRVGDLRRLPGEFKYLAMVPQWDLLDLLAATASEHASFTLQMNTEATGLAFSGDRVTGVDYRTTDGKAGRILADLTVACDGRHSVLRTASELPVVDWPVPFDVWWFRMPRKPDEPNAMVPVIVRPHPLILIDRGDYWQCAALLPKGTDAEQRRKPVSELIAVPAAGPLPWLADRVDILRSWDQVDLLDARLNRLRRWHRDGLLCIGDAAHAMSPVGGVGINLAIQDAVAAARLLARPLLEGTVRPTDLAKVRRRRLPATALAQRLQRMLHDKAVRPALDGSPGLKRGRQPLPIALLRRFPRLQGIPARIVARGFRPERAPDFARKG